MFFGPGCWPCCGNIVVQSYDQDEFGVNRLWLTILNAGDGSIVKVAEIENNTDVVMPRDIFGAFGLSFTGLCITSDNLILAWDGSFYDWNLNRVRTLAPPNGLKWYDGQTDVYFAQNAPIGTTPRCAVVDASLDPAGNILCILQPYNSTGQGLGFGAAFEYTPDGQTLIGAFIPNLGYQTGVAGGDLDQSTGRFSLAGISTFGGSSPAGCYVAIAQQPVAGRFSYRFSSTPAGGTPDSREVWLLGFPDHGYGNGPAANRVYDVWNAGVDWWFDPLAPGGQANGNQLARHVRSEAVSNRGMVPIYLPDGGSYQTGQRIGALRYYDTSGAWQRDIDINGIIGSGTETNDPPISVASERNQSVDVIAGRLQKFDFTGTKKWQSGSLGLAYGRFGTDLATGDACAPFSAASDVARIRSHSGSAAWVQAGIQGTPYAAAWSNSR
jgi:hypothetical protein